MWGYSFMINTNIGVYYDIIYILSVHFNNKYNSERINMNNLSNCILPFFFKKENDCSFMHNILTESYEELLLNGNIETIQNKLIDCENLTSKIINFYFGDINTKFIFNDFMSLSDLNRVITESKYPDELKNSLYSLFIEPVKTVHYLMTTLFDFDLQLKRIHKNYASNILKIQQDFLEPMMLEKLNLKDKITNNTPCAVSLFDKELLNFLSLKNGNYLLLLGEDYSNTLNSENIYALKDFGYALTEINRLKLLDMMKTNKEITIKDIELQLCLSGTNAYYHLSLMTKLNMVNTRYEGRTVFYSINKLYIKKMCMKLYEYSE